MPDLMMGARVIVVMERNDCFPWQTAPRFEATISHFPGGSGDTFRLHLDDGTEFALNGNGQSFVGLYALPTSRTPW